MTIIVKSGRTAAHPWSPLRGHVDGGHRFFLLARNVYHPATVQAVTEGLGEKVVERWWKVMRSRNPCVCYSVLGEERAIYGFRGFDHVFSRIIEEQNEIRAYFFPDKMAADSGKGLLKIVVLSERKRQNGNAPVWIPLKSPRVVASHVLGEPVGQEAHLAAQTLHTFLVTQQSVGSFLDLDPRLVNAKGQIRFVLENRPLTYSGYSSFKRKRVPGRVVVGRSKKRVYFWEKKSDRKSGQPPLQPEGHVMAQRGKGEHARWRIAWQYSLQQRSRVRRTVAYGKFLFTTVGSRTYDEKWPVVNCLTRGARQSRLMRRIRGTLFSLTLPEDIQTKSVFSRTTEVGGRIKIVEFWDDRRDFARLEPGFAVRCATFKPDKGPWQPFWTRLDDIAAFRSLLCGRWIAEDDLVTLLGHPFLQSRYGHIVSDAVLMKL